MNALATSQSFAVTRSGLFDVLAVWRLNRACFPKDAYDLITLFNMALMPRLVRLKAVVDGQIAGYVAGEINQREGCGWIITIGVHPDYTSRGIGAALLSEAERALGSARVRLTVRRSNDRAISLYKRCGYAWVSTYMRYYHDGEDGLVMEKAITPSA
jgi:ribosomal-protein-alanine N-acetyltransferase